MLELLIDNIFVMLDGCVFQQTDGNHMNTYRAPLLVDLFLYSHEADFIQGLVKKNEKELARSFNFTFRYIDFIDRSYPIEPEIKDTTDIARCTSYLDIHLSINN